MRALVGCKANGQAANAVYFRGTDSRPTLAPCPCTQAEAKRMQAQLRGEGAPSDDEDGSIEDVDFYADE